MLRISYNLEDINMSDDEHWPRLKWRPIASTNYTGAVSQLRI